MLEIFLPSIAAVAAISAAAFIFGLILSVAKLKLNVEKDPRIDQILELLPGTNCGACGMPGCAGYASKIVIDGVEVTLCPAGGDETAAKIAALMGIDNRSSVDSLIARVHCQGGKAEAENRFAYSGPLNCSAAHQILNGFKTCEAGCLGFGDCFDACVFDAIVMNDNGLPEIDRDKCTGCNKCVEACPRSIISMIPEEFDVYVICRNKERARVMLAGCSAGCTACLLCVKACREVFTDNPDIETAINVVDNLAVIDYSLCINCGMCAEACKKQKVISFGRLK